MMDTTFDVNDEMSDDVLLVRFGNGDKTAAQMLTQRLAPRVLNYAARLLGDPTEAEDVAQEAMLRLWKMAANWRQGEAKVTTWLYRVTTNLCTDRLRKQRLVAIGEIAEPRDDKPSVEAKIQTATRLSALNEALAKLPERQRNAVVLRHIEGLPNPQIAEILETSCEAIESLTARGKRALADSLASRRNELGYEDD